MVILSVVAGINREDLRREDLRAVGLSLKLTAIAEQLAFRTVCKTSYGRLMAN
jgi:hypothetical protein